MVGTAALVITLLLGGLASDAAQHGEIPLGQAPRGLRGGGSFRKLWDLEPPPAALSNGRVGHYYQWMWADAGKDFEGSHDLAEINPFRWSDWLEGASVIRDLQDYDVYPNKGRPVELRMATEQVSPESLPPGRIHRFASIAATVEFIRKREGKGDLSEEVQVSGEPLPGLGESLPTIVIVTPRDTSGAPPPTTSVATPPPSIATPPVTTRTTPMPGALPAATRGKPGLDWESVLVGAAILPLVCMGYFCFRSLRKSSQKGGKEEVSSSEDEDERIEGRPHANPAQALRGAREAGELKQLLENVELEESSLARRALGSADPSQKEEALREVERILEARNPQSIFGQGTLEERRAEFRRLVRLLHPDKGYVTGERAGLALRRVVESQP